MSPDQLNQLTPNRATLTLSNLPNTTYTAIEYQIPGIHLPSANQEMPAAMAPFFGDQVQFEPLQITFLVDDKLQNWKELFQWIAGNAPPTGNLTGAKSFKDIDAILTVYSAHNNPILRIKFRNCVGTDLSGIDFQSDSMETQFIRSTLVLAYHYFEF